jgi:hypothetical protein
MIVLGVINIIVPYYDSNILTENDTRMLTLLFFVFCSMNENISYQLWFLVMRNIILSPEDVGNIWTFSLSIFWTLSFQDNFLFIMAIFDIVGILILFQKRYHIKKDQVPFFAKIAIAYHVILCIYSLIFAMDDLFYRIFHALSILTIMSCYYGAVATGIFFFLDWCNKMNLRPYFIYSINGKSYHNKCTLCSFLFNWGPFLEFYIDDPHRQLYVSNQKTVTDDNQIKKRINSINLYFDDESINIEDTHQDDITKIFFNKILLSNTSVSVETGHQLCYKKITVITETNTAIIDTYYLIKHIVNKFCKHDDVAVVILDFFAKIHYYDVSGTKIF